MRGRSGRPAAGWCGSVLSGKPSALIQASDGNFYGTTKYGGGTGCFAGAGCGTIFRMTPGGVVTILHAFTGPDYSPEPSSLIEASDGNFYGTTAAGGAYTRGDIYRMTAAGTVTVLHTFIANGSGSTGPLMQASDGTLYGTTRSSANSNATIIRMTLAGDLTVVHTFDPGWAAPSLLTQGANGDLYGTSIYSTNGTGVAFELTLAGPPVIASQPQSQTITPGQTATLSVGAVGSGLSFQWYVSTSGTTYAVIDGATSSSYTTPPLTTTKSYWVRVSNASGTADSQPATILVAIPPTITGQPESQLVMEGRAAVFGCAASGTPIPTFQWEISMDGGVSWTWASSRYALAGRSFR